VFGRELKKERKDALKKLADASALISGMSDE
jgi:hypothetical protein